MVFRQSTVFASAETFFQNSGNGTLTQTYVTESMALNDFLPVEPINPQDCSSTPLAVVQYLGVGSTLNYTIAADSSSAAMNVTGTNIQKNYNYTAIFQGLLLT